MVADVHRNHAHVNAELELARTEVAEALADATLAELELKAERDQMQDFYNRLGSVAGKNFVFKMVRKFEQSLKTGDESLEDESELELQYPDDEELQYPDHEDSNGSNEGEVDHQDVEEDFGGGSGESEEGSQDAEDEEYSRSGDDSYRERSELPSASRPCSPYWYLYEFVRDGEFVRVGETNFRESSEPPPVDESPNSSLQAISHRYHPISPD
ncbi:hypothetical protein EV702DRAFT_1153130 [Suillus placidus]|uniref:Uncharacterized protein n=1 Tax=Suillus placidus TaxID=48579 RepID=A0A9P6ZH99_9AGAM|nr:hypothetical protein EV702DRAFT_1153130 [Suillus placidus]